MGRTVKAAFENEVALLPASAILPLRAVPENVRNSVKFKRIAQSIAEVGVIEPIVVARSTSGDGKFLLLDGHVRFSILMAQGVQEVACLVAHDDEAFTYNKRINRLATIQEHFMIMRALERGVSEQKLAKALDVDIKHLKRRRGMLEGISPEVVELLKDKSVNPVAFDILRKMKPFRQIEAAELMISAGNYTMSYAKALLAGTRQADLLRPDQPKKIDGMTPEQMERMEREMAALTQDFKALEASYGDDVLHLVIASGYLTRLVTNSAIERYLKQRHPELLGEFRAIISAASLDQAASST
jgi:hypothetical protein